MSKYYFFQFLNSNIILNGKRIYYGFIFSAAGRRAALILPNSGIFATVNRPWGLGFYLNQTQTILRYA